MSGKEMKYINEAFNLNWIAPLGNNVNGFEEELAEYSNVKSVAVLSSGTSAIHLALRLYDVKPEDTVFCSSLTFVASANPIDRKSTRLNSSHVAISYAVFCLK